ncbi:hypothetical protein [Tropicimonas sp. IMCC6043]|uniref:hypothetical protein n=1 Tax=Tropicimonas sp. IMCC6043 TaxID=2510645 RepID=UPI00101CB2E7|nr:hypothetical protein [Tropicimonas sp. IMCC6043]RYH06131.1 hypothetical protein EU800_24880 [Tropicimonas sp. IMCC6043]
MIDPAAKKRVLIAAGSYADAAAAIRLAERLAAGLIAELGGLLVDDEAIAEAAGLPVQRVVTSAGRLVEAPSRQRLAAQMEGDARAFRMGLSGVARTSPVKCVLERRHGDLIAGLCEAAGGWDLLLVGHRTRRRAGRVVLLDTVPAACPEAVEIARRIADGLETEVVTLALAPQGRPPSGVEVASSEDELLALVNRMHSAVVIIDLAAGPFRGREQLRHLIEAARCPVLVLNASEAEPALAYSTLIPAPPGSAAPGRENGT